MHSKWSLIGIKENHTYQHSLLGRNKGKEIQNVVIVFR